MIALFYVISPPQYIHDVCWPRLREGFAKGQRSEDSFKLILGPLTAVGKDAGEVAAAREKNRNLLGFLFSTPAYWPSLELFGWQAKGQQLLDLTRNGSWEKMPEIITDEMLDRFVPSGTYDEIAAILIQRYAGLTGRITFPMPDDPADDPLVAGVIRQLQLGQ